MFYWKVAQVSICYVDCLTKLKYLRPPEIYQNASSVTSSWLNKGKAWLCY